MLGTCGTASSSSSSFPARSLPASQRRAGTSPALALRPRSPVSPALEHGRPGPAVRGAMRSRCDLRGAWFRPGRARGRCGRGGRAQASVGGFPAAASWGSGAGREGMRAGGPAVCVSVSLSVVTLKRPYCGSKKGDTERSSLRGEEGFSPRHNVRPALRGGVEAARRSSGVFYGVGVLTPPGGPRGQFPMNEAPSWPCALAQLIPAHSLF